MKPVYTSPPLTLRRVQFSNTPYFVNRTGNLDICKAGLDVGPELILPDKVGTRIQFDVYKEKPRQKSAFQFNCDLEKGKKEDRDRISYSVGIYINTSRNKRLVDALSPLFDELSSKELDWHRETNGAFYRVRRIKLWAIAYIFH